MKYLLIIPTYNEMDNIEAIIKAVFKQTGRPFSQQKQDNKSDLFDLNLLIVDDNSPDKTSDKVEDMMKHEERLHILKRPGKKGLGTAYVEGFL